METQYIAALAIMLRYLSPYSGANTSIRIIYNKRIVIV